MGRRKKVDLPCMEKLPDPDVGCEWVFKGRGFMASMQVRYAFLGDNDAEWRIDVGFPGGMENGVYAVQHRIDIFKDIAAVPKALLQQYIEGVWQCQVPPVFCGHWGTLDWINWINRYGIWKAHNRRSHEILRGKQTVHGSPMSPEVQRDHGGILLPGHVLYTKDGRKIGNAILLRHRPGETDEGVYDVETDFGNVASLTRGELLAWWWLTDAAGEVRLTDVEAWRMDRQMTRLKTHAKEI